MAKGKVDRRSPLRIEDSAQVANLVWAVVYWTPTDKEKTSHVRGLVQGYWGPTREQFAQLVTSFIPNDAVVYAHFSSFLGEIPDIAASVDKQGLKRDSPTSGEKFQSLLAEVHKQFVYDSYKNNSSWESDPWLFAISKDHSERLESQFSDVSRNWIITQDILREADLLICNTWEHGVEVLSYRTSFEDLNRIADSTARSFKWALEAL